MKSMKQARNVIFYQYFSVCIRFSDKDESKNSLELNLIHYTECSLYKMSTKPIMLSQHKNCLLQFNYYHFQITATICILFKILCTK